MAEPNSITINIHAPVPADEPVVEALFRNLLDLATECEKAGWQASISFSMTKEKENHEPADAPRADDSGVPAGDG